MTQQTLISLERLPEYLNSTLATLILADEALSRGLQHLEPDTSYLARTHFLHAGSLIAAAALQLTTARGITTAPTDN